MCVCVFFFFLPFAWANQLVHSLGKWLEKLIKTNFRLKHSVRKYRTSFSDVPLLRNFPRERQEKPCSIFLSARFFQGRFDNGIRTKRTYHAIYSPFPLLNLNVLSGYTLFFSVRIKFIRISRLKIAKS